MPNEQAARAEAAGKAASRASPATIEAERLRSRLEAARLELRALYRALDRLALAQHVPTRLLQLGELDADLAEALWVLDQPRGKYNVAAMVTDTMRSLNRIPVVREAFLASFDPPTRAMLDAEISVARAELSPDDAYLEIPGRDPAA